MSESSRKVWKAGSAGNWLIFAYPPADRIGRVADNDWHVAGFPIRRNCGPRQRIGCRHRSPDYRFPVSIIAIRPVSSGIPYNHWCRCNSGFYICVPENPGGWYPALVLLPIRDPENNFFIFHSSTIRAISFRREWQLQRSNTTRQILKILP